MQNKKPRFGWRLAMGAVALAAVSTSTGCQSLVGGQVLPSPFYQQDDVQYFGPGPEFKLSREAAAQKAYASEQTQEQAQP